MYLVSRLDHFTDLSVTARALATPVRLCAFTSVKLPSHFLMPFVTEFRPLQSPKAATKDDGKDETKLVPHLVPRDVTSHAGPSVYALNSQALLRRLSKKRGWHRLASRDMADKYKIRDKKDWIWDDATDQQALSSMRRTLVGKLKWSFKMPNAKLVRALDDTEMESRRAACILQLRSRSELPQASGHINVASDESKVRHSEGSLPLFYLPELLGDEATSSLVEGTQFATSDAIVLANSYLTASTHVELLKLQAFLGGTKD